MRTHQASLSILLLAIVPQHGINGFTSTNFAGVGSRHTWQRSKVDFTAYYSLHNTTDGAPVSNTIAIPKFQNPLFIPKEVNDYVLDIGFHESNTAKELRFETANHPLSEMMGCPTEAAMFKLLLPAIGAKNVIEVGVFTGYSTLVMAEAIGPDGKILALDISDEFTSIGKPFWDEAGVTDRIDLQIGNAVESLQNLLDAGQEGTFDFVFIDADKTTYRKYYELVLKLVRKNGIIAIDNVLNLGKVLDADKYTDVNTVALRDISKVIYKDKRVEHVLLPFADGITLVRKK